MLGSRILPSGIGHTTSCFVQVQGTNQEQGYLQQESISESENNGTLSEVIIFQKMIFLYPALFLDYFLFYVSHNR